MGIVAAMLIEAIVALIDGDTRHAIAWFGFVAAGVLIASDATERWRGLSYLSIVPLIVSAAFLVSGWLLAG